MVWVCSSSGRSTPLSPTSVVGVFVLFSSVVATGQRQITRRYRACVMVTDEACNRFIGADRTRLLQRCHYSCHCNKKQWSGSGSDSCRRSTRGLIFRLDFKCGLGHRVAWHGF